ncbi:hypothetical protein JZ751_020257 [Albula glossodonta]|uniref:Uncharacterized protein n=1 Tax=Albula glossodonta TaxID=121402 RepID=A0A8T2MRU1_9TELE|nr:hypothetical protein JZ751_020257 [Albula glossodonta]
MRERKTEGERWVILSRLGRTGRGASQVGMGSFEVRLRPVTSPCFFIPGFPKLQRFQAHHDHILSRHMGKLKKHLVRTGAAYGRTGDRKPPRNTLGGPDKEQMYTGIYTTKWFLQCFIERRKQQSCAESRCLRIPSLSEETGNQYITQ